MDEELKKLENYEKEELLKKLKVRWIYNSNAIEGNTLSEGDTSFIIESGLTVRGKSLSEHNQVVGHKKALDLIYSMLEQDTISEDDLFLLHQAIQTEHVIDYEKPNGAYKVVPNGRWVNVNGKSQHYYYTHPDFTQHLMNLWFKEFGTINIPISSKEDSIRIYTNMHISFTTIHPFWDGNGRLARLVSNLPLLRAGYLPIIIDSSDREEYKDLQFQYQIVQELGNNTKEIINEELPQYKNLICFFEKQYKNTFELLNEIRASKKRLGKTVNKGA